MSFPENIPPGAGPDGGSLLGFLCSLGALWCLHKVYPKSEVKLRWRRSLGWRPVWEGIESNADSVCEKLTETLTSAEALGRFTIAVQTGSDKKQAAEKKDSKEDHYLNPDHISAEDFRSLISRAMTKQEPLRGETLQEIASFGSEMDTASTSTIVATALCALGASQQYFFKHARALIEGLDKITAAKVRSALMEVWSNQDSAQSFRWEPSEERSYALRFRDPSKTKEKRNEIRTMHAANRLALEALRFFPVAPALGRIKTRGFRYEKGREFFTWPVWETALNVTEVATLAGHPEFVEKAPRRAVCEALGVSEAFRVERRILQKGARHFSAPRPCLLSAVGGSVSK